MPDGTIAAPDEHAPHQHHPALQHHFQDLEQQHEASTLGMWLFLVTEVMFFGGLILAYSLYRIWYPVAWALGSEELNIYLGGFNTAVLIGSSLTMALAVRSAQTGAPKATVRWLLLTMAFGLTFLVVKFFEYKEKFELHHVPGPNFHFEGPESPHVQIFFSLYFALTGVHALHMIIGFGLLSVIATMAARKRFSPEWYTPVELAGLYWHFVDIVWIFLFPLLYLVDRSHHII
ncbi:MAG TPA: cytochrome c oxidase subunit 3 family protein [Vicinamibacterales bacterium]|nr:cytochrome c oxidase subunit 3 family protein [Vicinamibacterales bacterium]